MGFPKYVYKRGTAEALPGERFKAESELVKSEEELAALGPGWCESPAEAGGKQDEEKPAAKVEIFKKGK